jgi:glycosyltransferase involved in cell wall biosynthesis
MVVDALVMLKRRHPDLQAVIAGEGYMRTQIVEALRANGAEDWIQLPGRLTDDELVDLYRRAWVLVSASAREGWGMTITEAGACGTPAVATKVVGQVDTVDSGVTGLLAADREELVGALDTVLSDDGLRSKLSKGALASASCLTWDATARQTLQVLAAEVARVNRVDLDPAMLQLDLPALPTRLIPQLDPAIIRVDDGRAHGELAEPEASRWA